jgi:hypothetical protein
MEAKSNNRVRNEHDWRSSKFIVVPFVDTEVHLLRETLPARFKKAAVEPASNREHTTAIAQQSRDTVPSKMPTRRLYSRHA